MLQPLLLAKLVVITNELGLTSPGDGEAHILAALLSIKEAAAICFRTATCAEMMQKVNTMEGADAMDKHAYAAFTLLNLLVDGWGLPIKLPSL